MTIDWVGWVNLNLSLTKVYHQERLRAITCKILVIMIKVIDRIKIDDLVNMEQRDLFC